jgi:threonylcarbamoyladenosine tRNA methylthiotransferase MtaB
MRIRLETLGCRLNEAELETWARQLQARGLKVAGPEDSADLVVVNTCAVTNEAVRKSRKLLRRSQRENPRARLVVSGCAVSVGGAANLDTSGVDLLVDNRDKDRLVEIAAEALALPLMPDSATEPGATALFPRRRQRAFVKIQDGCRYQCTFCIVTEARGEERSRPAADICDEINHLVAQGVQEVVLTGVQAGGWGRDLGDDLAALLQRVLRETDCPRIRLGSVEPWDLGDRFWRLFEDLRLLPHLHLPLQSGSDRILRRMARRCKSAEFERLVKEARTAIPDFNCTTDIIVGFPGETEADWQATLTLCERIGFGHIHIFAFSPRTGTRAAGMADQIPIAIKRARSQALHEIATQGRTATQRRFIGQVVPVLVEGRCSSGDGRDWCGYTPNYLMVRIPGHLIDDAANRMIQIRLEGIDPHGEAIIGVPATS